MLCKLMLPEIRELIETRDSQTLSEVLDMWQPADIAELFADLDDDDERAAFQLLHGPQRTLIFEYLDRPTQHKLLESLEPADAGALFNDMAADDRTALLEELDDADREKHLRTLSDQQQAIARSLLEFPEDSVGRLMSPDFVAVRSNWTVEHVLDHVRRHGQDSETLNVVYVVDHDMHLIDDLRIRQILLAPVHTTIERLMDSNFVNLKATDLKRSAIEVFRRYDRTALPVVDDHGRLVGIVTIDDVLDVAEQAATEDAQKFGGLEALSEPYSTTPLLTMVHKRATWLVILFLGELLTATAMGYFEHEIAKAVVLALFVPLIISSGGNSGSQAATLIVRALAVGEIRLSDWLSVFRRELISGAILGLILGTIGFLRIALWSAFSNIYGPHWMLVGVSVSLSLVAIVLWGSIIGSMLPFGLKRLGLDPATSSAPFVATFVDVTGLVIYFTVSMVVLRGTML
ncbi:magnesium transporter [Schlesneria paludicola]|uniref:magnesium transporter n=1 Tax=Schlesneria paludicola TaxID=360056 RepID=UPI00029A6A56|nr:magnesium transporter [Schlesneria paludicola]